jgi:hypothetical protein
MKGNPSFEARIKNIVDITGAKRKDIQKFKKNGYGLIVLERFAFCYGRLPKNIAEIKEEIEYQGTIYLNQDNKRKRK